MVVFAIFYTVMYFLPSVIAGLRKLSNTPKIIVINLLLGWTIVFWILALVWSLKKQISPSSQATNSKIRIQANRSIYGETDPSSEMEPEVLKAIQETEFWKHTEGQINLTCNFPIWQEMLRPPKQYRVDFFISYQNHRIVIEYDGWVHFYKAYFKVTKDNWRESYSEEDMERQKHIEASGFKVIRLNRYNLQGGMVHVIDREIKSKMIGCETEEYQKWEWI